MSDNSEKYLEKVFTKKQNIWLIVSGSVLILFLIVLMIGKAAARSQSSQTAAQRWGKDEEYAHISLFFSELEGVEEDTINQLNFSIDSKLDEDSIMTKSLAARRRVSAYSNVGKVNVASAQASKEYKAVGCGGDFFIFHPLKLLYGSYFDGDDLMQDHVILDENAAWDLFGSSDIVGQVVEVNGKRHIVSGVIKRDTGRLNKLAGNNESTIYLTYESMSSIAGNSTINCYEVLMPNPVTRYAAKLVKEAVSIEENRYELIENSSRFHWTRLIQFAAAPGARSMNEKTILYPYWENMARGLEDMITPLSVIGVLFASFVIINVCVLLIRMWINRNIHIKDVKNLIERGIEKHRENVKRKKDEGEYI